MQNRIFISDLSKQVLERSIFCTVVIKAPFIWHSTSYLELSSVQLCRSVQLSSAPFSCARARAFRLIVFSVLFYYCSYFILESYAGHMRLLKTLRLFIFEKIIENGVKIEKIGYFQKLLQIPGHSRWLEFGLVNRTGAKLWDLYFLKVLPLGGSKRILGNSLIFILVQ